MVTADSVYVTPVEDKVEVNVEQVLVDVVFQETTVIVTPATDTTPTFVEVSTTDQSVEIINQTTEVIVNPEETVVVVTPGGEPGPPGADGAGASWGPPDLISTAGVNQLSIDCSNYIQVDCTAGPIEVRLPDFNEWLTKAIRVDRISSGSNMVIVTAAGNLSGFSSLDLAYRGEVLEFVAFESGWRVQ